MPARYTNVIATSNAQNDAGVFEFGFRDERYMPFEGAGAISNWRLTLPKTFPSFDYQTISDVIVRLSYTAEYDEQWGTELEHHLSQTQKYVLASGTELEPSALATTGLTCLFSMRHEFPDVWSQLTRSSFAKFELTDRYLPFIVTGLARLGLRLATSDIDILVRTEDMPTFKLELDDVSLSFPWEKDAKSGGLYKATVKSYPILNVHKLKFVSNSSEASSGDVNGSEISKIEDIYLRFKIRIEKITSP